MKKAFIGLLATMLFIAFGPNCFSQNGLITSEDYHLTARLNGADCFIGNALVEVYSDVVMAKYYKSGEKVLSGHTETYNFDKVDNNGNRVYLSNVESSTYNKLTYYSNGTILISTYSITYIPYVGRKDIPIADYRFTKGYVKASSNGASNNNSYNNSYNNTYNNSSSSSSSPTRVTCPRCNGKRYHPESYTDCADIYSYNNQAGTTCYICGQVTKHCHYPCLTCQSRGTVEKY